MPCLHTPETKQNGLSDKTNSDRFHIMFRWDGHNCEKLQKKCSAHVARLCIQLRDTLKKENGMKKSGTAIAVPLLILNVTIMEQYKGRERLCLYLLRIIGIAEKGRKKDR